MGYRFKRSESVQKGVRRIAGELLDESVSLLDPAEPLDEDRVHDVRTAMKRLRALLRLTRDSLGEQTYKRENACFRDAARALSPARDATVSAQALEHLADGRGSAARAFPGVHDALVRERDAGDHARTAREVRAELAKARRRAQGWSLAERGFDALEPGLRASYGAARDALRACESDPSDANFHALRRRGKTVLYQLRLLERADARREAPRVRALTELTDALGDAHDLAVLEGRLLARPERYGRAGEVEAVVGRIARKKRALEEHAKGPGERLLGGKPRARVQELEAEFAAWRQRARS